VPGDRAPAVAFGTDGIRGVANLELTAELALSLGRAAVGVLGGDQWLIGADTRVSGPMLVAALTAGLAAAGADVVDLGVVPTPAVAFHAQQLGCPAAIVSASHNPYTDNGIKLLAAGGRKLRDDVESAVAARMNAGATSTTGVADPRAGVGRIRRHPDPLGAYAAHVVASIEGRRFDGMKLVIDCANGAASEVAPAVLRSLGADVTVLSATPDGTNINAGCGSTHPAPLQAAVVEAGAEAGLAFDGDADRVVAVGADGRVVDGDHIMAILAGDLHDRHRLRGEAVAVTVMSNLGLRLALGARGIGVVETPVGDRYVLEAMEADDLALGGEQSGHVIFRDLATTGDGLLTGVQLLDVVSRAGVGLAALAAGAMTRLPQVLRNVRVARPEGLAAAASVRAAVVEAEAELGSTGRVLLRPSGTEPVIRVMVEAPTEPQARELAERLTEAVTSALGGG
jgi:phosphoglucosamine mutase